MGAGTGLALPGGSRSPRKQDSPCPRPPVPPSFPTHTILVRSQAHGAPSPAASAGQPWMEQNPRAAGTSAWAPRAAPAAPARGCHRGLSSTDLSSCSSKLNFPLQHRAAPTPHGTSSIVRGEGGNSRAAAGEAAPAAPHGSEALGRADRAAVRGLGMASPTVPTPPRHGESRQHRQQNQAPNSTPQSWTGPAPGPSHRGHAVPSRPGTGIPRDTPGAGCRGRAAAPPRSGTRQRSRAGPGQSLPPRSHGTRPTEGRRGPGHPSDPAGHPAAAPPPGKAGLHRREPGIHPAGRDSGARGCRPITAPRPWAGPPPPRTPAGGSGVTGGRGGAERVDRLRREPRRERDPRGSYRARRRGCRAPAGRAPAAAAWPGRAGTGRDGPGRSGDLLL